MSAAEAAIEAYGKDRKVWVAKHVEAGLREVVGGSNGDGGSREESTQGDAPASEVEAGNAEGGPTRKECVDGADSADRGNGGAEEHNGKERGEGMMDNAQGEGRVHEQGIPTDVEGTVCGPRTRAAKRAQPWRGDLRTGRQAGALTLAPVGAGGRAHPRKRSTRGSEEPLPSKHTSK